MTDTYVPMQDERVYNGSIYNIWYIVHVHVHVSILYDK